MSEPLTPPKAPRQATDEQPELPGLASAPELEARLLAGIIAELRALPSCVGGEYQNAWCDLIGNVQEGDEAIFDHLFRDIVLNIFAVLIRRLPAPERERVWFLTDRGHDYDFERRWQKGAEPDEHELVKLHRTPDEQVEDIAKHLRSDLYNSAVRANLEGEVRRHRRSLFPR